MRSSGRTAVSRTIARIASVRRSRRGLRVNAALPTPCPRSVPGIVFIVIFVSMEEVVARAVGGAESPPRPPHGAVGTEVPGADGTPLEPRILLGVAAPDAASRNIPRSHMLSIIRGLSRGGVAQMVRAGVS